MPFSNGDDVVYNGVLAVVEFDDGTTTWIVLSGNAGDALVLSADLTAASGVGFNIGDTVGNFNYPTDPRTYLVLDIALHQFDGATYHDYAFLQDHGGGDPSTARCDQLLFLYT